MSDTPNNAKLYRVRFTKEIRCFPSEPEFVTLHRTINLPFPPYPGLQVTLEDWFAVVQSVKWDDINQEFRVRASTDTTISDADQHGISAPSFKDLIKVWVKYGWKLPPGICENDIDELWFGYDTPPIHAKEPT